MQCRHEWYQLAASVILTIYAKDVAKEESKVEFSDRTVNVELKLNDGRKFTKVFKLAEVFCVLLTLPVYHSRAK